MKASDEHQEQLLQKEEDGRELGGGKLGENWEEANWARTTDGQGASGKKFAVKWNVGELAMNCLASDSRI